MCRPLSRHVVVARVMMHVIHAVLISGWRRVGHGRVRTSHGILGRVILYGQGSSLMVSSTRPVSFWGSGACRRKRGATVHYGRDLA
jgi:hypothetical protein